MRPAAIPARPPRPPPAARETAIAQEPPGRRLPGGQPPAGVPQLAQNLAVAGSSVPHWVQCLTAGASG